MIEYAKVILPKVCFWKSLFKKELMKCKSWANSDELDELSAWCYKNFSDMYPDVLDEVFNDFANGKKSKVISSSISENSPIKQIRNTKKAGLSKHTYVLL